jgi:hypothetical protein
MLTQTQTQQEMEDQTSASPYEISITFSGTCAAAPSLCARSAFIHSCTRRVTPGNPLDRVNNRRKDVAFLAAQLESAASVCIPFHRLSPLLLRSSDESATRTHIITAVVLLFYYCFIIVLLLLNIKFR